VASADRVLAVTPEYNGTMPAVLNNAIDWLSRPYGQGAIVGKPFAAIGATPTPYGGKWSHEHARHSATIAGAVVVDGIVVDESAVAGDPLADEAAVQRLLGALDALVAHEVEAAGGALA
jgi:NAD(P)H-dependent FMN reductase